MSQLMDKQTAKKWWAVEAMTIRPRRKLSIAKTRRQFLTEKEKPMSEDKFEGWAILELMGHRRLAGRLSEQTIGGAALIRIDIPSQPPVTQFYGGAAVYCITPTTEDIATAVARRTQEAPVHRYELAHLLAPEPASERPPSRQRDFEDDDQPF